VLLATAARALYRVPYFRGRDRALDALLARLPAHVDTALDGVRLRLDTRETTQAALLLRGHLEPLTVAALRRLLRPGDTYVDVGAHAGVLAMVGALAVGATGRVVAIEPQPALCDRLLTNAALNGARHVVALPAAAGDVDGWVTLRMQHPSDRTRLSLAAHEPNATEYAFEAPLVRLDSVFRRLAIARARVLKIDVEGFELAVLRGCFERLRDVDAVIAELLPGSEHTETLAALLGAGFELHEVTGARFRSVDALPEHNVLAMRL
jgi:FkbM family methyltransferase